jgi:guanosine-3',5'-bis(diphosphate) 3'-pyrophosphohydrolase
MNRFEFFDRIPAMPQRQRQLIQWAYIIAKKWHDGQERDSGERYFEHVRGVATILIDHGYVKAPYIILAILHDCPEDTDIPLSMLEKLFGPKTAREILTVSKVYGIEDPLTGFVTHSQKRSPEDYFAGIRRCGERTSIVKCADRIHNLTDLVDSPPDSDWTPQRRMKQVVETRQWIIPLAHEFEPRFADKLTFFCDLIEARVQPLLVNP